MSTIKEPVRFAAIGLNHGHIYGQVEALLRAGAELVAFHAPEEEHAQPFSNKYPQAKRVLDKAEILENPSISLITSASIPHERAPLGIEVMRHGKDFFVDKPGIINLTQLHDVRKVQKETGRIYSIFYGERFENRATVKASELVQAGAIGQVVQTIGLGPHRLNAPSRPKWFWETQYYGGILIDIASHQIDQFLFFTGSTEAEILHSNVANYSLPHQPFFEDFGELLIRGNGGHGYVRVDWYTPNGLPTWGDGRLTILGTEGYIELRKYCDPAGREGGNHLFLADQKGVQHIDCNQVELPFARQLLDDVRNRTETAMSQTHCFLATEMAVWAQRKANRLGHLNPQN